MFLMSLIVSEAVLQNASYFKMLQTKYNWKKDNYNKVHTKLVCRCESGGYGRRDAPNPTKQKNVKLTSRPDQTMSKWKIIFNN